MIGDGIGQLDEFEALIGKLEKTIINYEGQNYRHR